MIVMTKRVYLNAEENDGFRVLVDRLWPRGIKKEDARLDLWAKALAPSTELRKWFGHKPELFDEFSEKYKAEIKANPEAMSLIAKLKEHPVVTLLYGAKDEEHNNAVVLRDLMLA